MNDDLVILLKFNKQDNEISDKIILLYCCGHLTNVRWLLSQEEVTTTQRNSLSMFSQ